MTVPRSPRGTVFTLEYAMKFLRRVSLVALVALFVVVLMWLRVHIRGGLWYWPTGE